MAFVVNPFMLAKVKPKLLVTKPAHSTPKPPTPPKHKPMPVIPGYHWLENGTIWLIWSTVVMPIAFMDYRAFQCFQENNFPGGSTWGANKGPFVGNEFYGLASTTAATDDVQFMFCGRVQVAHNVRIWLMENQLVSGSDLHMADSCFMPSEFHNMRADTPNGYQTVTPQYATIAHFGAKWQQGMPGMMFHL